MNRHAFSSIQLAAIAGGVILVGSIGLVASNRTYIAIDNGINPISNDTNPPQNPPPPLPPHPLAPQPPSPTPAPTPSQNTQGTVNVDGITGPPVVRQYEIRSWAADPPPNSRGKVTYRYCWGDGICGYGGTEEFNYADGSRPATTLHVYEETGEYTLRVDARDDTGTVTRRFKITVVPPITSISIEPQGSLDGKLDAQMWIQLKFRGATAPYHFKLTSGALPPGISLQKPQLSGAPCPPCLPDPPQDFVYLAGTPTKAGTYTFEIMAYDDAGHVGTRSFTSVISQ